MRAEPRSGRSERRLGRTWGAAGAIVVAIVAGVLLLRDRHEPAAATPLAGSRPSIVLISIDTLRSDHLHAYGYARETSPNIDALAASGVLFETALSPTSWTLPAHASLLSGITPLRHGAVDARTMISAEVPLLAELLRAQGYATEALVNAPFLEARYGFDRGFDRFHYQMPGKRKVQRRYHAHVLESVRAALARPEPAFLFLHYMDVHSPYRPPPEFDRFGNPGSAASADAKQRRANRLQEVRAALREGRTEFARHEIDELIDLYDGEILAMDAKVGQLMELVHQSARPVLVVLTSDHGEEFLEHGSVLHGMTLYEEVLRVPLIMAGPGIPAGLRVAAPVSLLDVTPTLLEVAGAPLPDGIDGRSLVADASGGDPQSGDGYLLDLHTASHKGKIDVRGLRTATHKRIDDRTRDRTELYDLIADPHEKRSLPPGSVPALAKAVDQREVERGGALPRPNKRVQESLEALGYVE